MYDAQDNKCMSTLTVRTKPGPYYIVPRKWEVDKALTERNTSTPKDYSILADLVNLSDPEGAFTNAEVYLHEIDEYVANSHITKQPDGYYQASNVGQYTTLNEAEQAIRLYRSRYHVKVREFLDGLLQEIDMKEIPGGSPVHRAITIVNMLGNSSKANSSGISPAPFFGGDHQGPQAAVQQIKEALVQAKKLVRDPSIMELLGYQQRAEGYEEGGGGTKSPDLIECKIAEDMVTGKGVIEKVARNLSQLSRMSVSRSYKRKPDPEGSISMPWALLDFNELPKMASSEWAYPKAYRNYRIVTQNARKYERCKEISKKQLLYTIVDCSGSMNGQKTFIAGGCIMRGLKAVCDDDAEMYVRFFDTSLKPEWYAKNKEEAKIVMKKVMEGNYSGGGTQIGACALGAVERIKHLVEVDKVDKPELLIVSDGDDDTSNLTADHFQGIKVHAIVIHASDEHLCQLARSTGGVGISITKSDY